MSIPNDLLSADADRQRADWNDVLLWRPALWRNGELYEFPRPVPVVRIHETWDAARFKVPLVDGDTLTGGSRNGLEIELRGQIVTAAADPLALLSALVALRDALHITGDDAKAWLFLLHDAAAETYRHVRGCSTMRFEYHLVDGHAVHYAAVLHADDPTIYDTAPE
jgi:hypothetical protein